MGLPWDGPADRDVPGPAQRYINTSCYTPGPGATSPFLGCASPGQRPESNLDPHCPTPPPPHPPTPAPGKYPGCPESGLCQEGLRGQLEGQSWSRNPRIHQLVLQRAHHRVAGTGDWRRGEGGALAARNPGPRDPHPKQRLRCRTATLSPRSQLGRPSPQAAPIGGLRVSH